jgi:hypothetical protein
MLHAFKLRSRSRTNVQSFISVYRAYSVSTDNVVVWIYEVQSGIERDDIRSAICTCYCWEMQLNIVLDASFDNIVT